MKTKIGHEDEIPVGPEDEIRLRRRNSVLETIFGREDENAALKTKFGPEDEIRPFGLGADRISASANSSAEFRRQAHFRRQAAGRLIFSEFKRRISASGTFSASGWGQHEFKLQGSISSAELISASGTFSAEGSELMTARRRAQVAPPTIGQATSLSAEFRRREHFRRRPGEPNLGFSAEFKRQDHFRLHSLAGSNIGAELERQPTFGFSQHRPNLGTEFRLQNLRFRGGTKPGPTSPGPCMNMFANMQ